MAEEKETKKKEEGWIVGLQILDENKPPIKVLQNPKTEETIDEWGYRAKVLNYLEELKKLL